MSLRLVQNIPGQLKWVFCTEQYHVTRVAFVTAHTEQNFMTRASGLNSEAEAVLDLYSKL